ncbi:SCO2523 family variant P-loop protein [Actinocorallia sp. A-T 12471]|uniref:SCO2523 family variant P-loop protein n=1 Tax=Actinocorallia sp. A-T 12471 TaxID=3089813 RepID=UPI0029CE3C75|nr:SCO2523 family variant P-loop protein [Actinocorallia sp. A-T 12471]MDX6739816.1 SCO2523 family variant P-loop protein [Actinocorallia sp. A-T 12471]
MLIISTSDKGGTGRTVTTCNVAYRRALGGDHVCYLDFDFGSPTAGSIFAIERISHGTLKGGLHSYLKGEVDEAERLDVWSESAARALRMRPSSVGRLVLLPGDLGGGEFSITDKVVERCGKLLQSLTSEFDTVFMDLSAGRSHAAELLLRVTSPAEENGISARWLVFHRWTRQHVAAAAGLTFGERGLLDTGERVGHRRDDLLEAIRFVRTAVIDPGTAATAGLTAEQENWLRRVNEELGERAVYLDLGRQSVIARIPLDPVLQWREQVITDEDVYRRIANERTVEAFTELAESLDDEATWSRV